MKIFTEKREVSTAKKLVADDMILTKDMPTSAGSRMLDGYMSLIESEALCRLKESGYGLCGKADVGEFAIDLVGESSYNGAIVKDGAFKNAAAEILTLKEAELALSLDVNGSVRRAAAQGGLVSVKPTYGTVSRYGVIPAACSGDTVSLMARTAQECIDALDIIAGHDDKDGTSLSEEKCALLKKSDKKIKKVAIVKSFEKGVDASVSEKLASVGKKLTESGIEVCEIENELLLCARAAWNILMCAELCNNVSRYDGVKYGYRTQNFTNLDELYTNSRTEAFGDLLKKAILFGSDTLSTENYKKVYDKALRVRGVISEEFSSVFESFDAILIPACSTYSYGEDKIEGGASFVENLYTAPASISGLPAVVFDGVQLVGPAFSDVALLGLAKLYESEGR